MRRERLLSFLLRVLSLTESFPHSPFSILRSLKPKREPKRERRLKQPQVKATADRSITEAMEVAWSGFRSVYPYSAPRYEGVRGDEEVEKLKQPLIGRDEYDPAADDVDCDYDYALEDEEAGLLSSSYDANHSHRCDQIKYANAQTTYKQQQSAYGGGFIASVEPKFLRSISKITELAASAFKASPLSSFAAAPKAKEKDGNYYGSRNSAGMISSIRSVVRTRRKTETMEDVTEKALARIAILTIACTVLLLLGVSMHAS